MPATPRPPVRRPLAHVLVGCALLPLALVAPAAASGDDDRVELRGSCSGRAEWKLRVRPDDGRLEVEAEVDSDRTGQRWAWKLRHNGSVTARGHSRTSGSSGSFDVERTIVDLAGTDEVRFRATYGRPVCRGVVHY